MNPSFSLGLLLSRFVWELRWRMSGGCVVLKVIWDWSCLWLDYISSKMVCSYFDKCSHPCSWLTSLDSLTNTFSLGLTDSPRDRQTKIRAEKKDTKVIFSQYSAVRPSHHAPGPRNITDVNASMSASEDSKMAACSSTSPLALNPVWRRACHRAADIRC